jgi:hypothetical protein
LAHDVSLEQIQRAIALGCYRKYVSLLNGSDNEPINSLAYFRELIEEAEDTETPAGYWSYVMRELDSSKQNGCRRSGSLPMQNLHWRRQKQNRRDDVV